MEFLFPRRGAIPQKENLFFSESPFCLEKFLKIAKLERRTRAIPALVPEARPARNTGILPKAAVSMVSPLQQKIRISGPVVITANRLHDGAVVHRTASGQWTSELGEALVLWSAEDALKTLKAAQTDGLEAVGPYVAPIDASEDAARPGNIRELIRTSGPTFSLPSDGGSYRSRSARLERTAA